MHTFTIMCKHHIHIYGIIIHNRWTKQMYSMYTLYPLAYIVLWMFCIKSKFDSWHCMKRMCMTLSNISNNVCFTFSLIIHHFLVCESSLKLANETSRIHILNYQEHLFITHEHECMSYLCNWTNKNQLHISKMTSQYCVHKQMILTIFLSKSA